ncbi:SusC/RagA family TonB-linked outer membrane protein [Arachidicoccus soli]|uniref:SusC/RagA family TonB-linked outer membrane protein n=2 Tax=Arachidicoccus soli TaxID=2341117 RepID=A0A386HS17_9BACT|nr:SusC/RagA family TonB-linked outer membrane protein [Arachidicoccus soli]
MMRFKIKLGLMTFLAGVSLNTYAQSLVKVQGTVLSESGKTLQAVSIRAVDLQDKKASLQLSDSAGRFVFKNLQEEHHYNLYFTYVGYNDDSITNFVIRKGEVNSILMRLKEDKTALQDVVIVGYGTQTKTNLTGAITQISGKVLEDRPISRLSQGLQGAVANLNITTQYGGGAPNATQSLNIRGYTGLGTSGGPLIVIDGVQGGDIDAINPNDVESITVVKDAASAAVYGSSAPNGVILITTKQGKIGAKSTITYNNNFNIATPIGLPKMLNSVTFANLTNEAFENAGSADWFAPDVIQRMKDYQAGKITTQTEPDPTGTNWLEWGAANANNDWFKIYFKKAQLSQQHNISVSGGTAKTTYFIGAGYNDRNGMYNYGNDYYKRFNLRANISTEITKWMKFNLRTAYSKELYNTPNSYAGRTGGNYMHQIARKHPNIPLYDPNGAYDQISDVPLQLYGGRYNENWDKPTITGEFVFNLAKGWSTTVNYTYDATLNNISNHVKTVYYTNPDGSQSAIGGSTPNGFSRSSKDNTHQVVNAFSTYEKSYGNHHFKLLGGFESELYQNEGQSASVSNLFSDNVPSLSLAYGTTPSVSDNSAELASEGIFGRFNYDFKGKYLLNLVGRYDGTSRFLRGSRWVFNPGISAGWNIYKENFWKNLGISKVVNTLKVRGSYGSLGDQSLGLTPSNTDGWYRFYPSLGTSTPTQSNWLFNDGREAAISTPPLVNTSLTWMTIRSLDFGLDASLLRDRLTATFDWYKRSTNDYVGPPQQLPSVLGTGVPQTNSAAMETKGFELTIAWRDQIGQVNYGIKGMLSNYKGTVTKFPNPEGLLNNWYVGETMGQILGYKTAGYFKDDADVTNSPSQKGIYTKWGAGDIKYVDVNKDGAINYGKGTTSDMGDLVVLGNSTPQYAYSFLGDVSWKGFDASFFIQGIAKRDAYLSSNYFFGIVGNVWQSSPFTTNLDRWTPETPNGYFPKYYMSGENAKNQTPNGYAQSKYLLNAAYMRIKNIQIGYTLPKNLFKQIGVQRLRVYVSVDNLATFTPMDNHSNLDPELSISDAKIYPLQRNYSFGLNLTF